MYLRLLLILELTTCDKISLMLQIKDMRARSHSNLTPAARVDLVWKLYAEMWRSHPDLLGRINRAGVCAPDDVSPMLNLSQVETVSQ